MSADDIYPLDDARQYTDFSADVDLIAGSPRGNQPARYLRVEDVTAGTTLAVEMASGDGATRTFTVKADWELIGKVTTIKSATNVSRITVGW